MSSIIGECGQANYVVPGANACAGGEGAAGVNSLNTLSGDLTISNSDDSLNINASGSSIDVTSNGILSLAAGNNITIKDSGDVRHLTISSYPYINIGQYYKSVAQVVGSGSTAITFDVAQSWNTNDYITHTEGTSTFNVVTAGLYQLEFALTVAGNGATWTASKSASINILRVSNSALLQQSLYVPSGNGYAAQVVGTLFLEAGDVVSCVNNGALTSGNVSVTGLQNTFDLNTTFTWTYIPYYKVSS